MAAYRRLSLLVSNWTLFISYISFTLCLHSHHPTLLTLHRSSDGAASDFATRNIATTAGLAVAAGTAVAGAAILTAALPGHVIVAAGTTGALLYVGDRQYNGKPIIPGRGGDTTPVADAVAPAAA